MKTNRNLRLFMIITVILSLFLVSCGKTDSGSEKSKSVSANEKGVFLPIIMYHSVVSDASKSGDYVITPEILRSDISYLIENGYETVSISQVIDYVTNGKPLPEKPVVLTFDDGHYNFLTNVLPILEETNCCATLSVVGSYAKNEEEQDGIQSSSYSYLTFDQIKQLSECGYVEIASHSYNLHMLGSRQGALKIETESYEEYRSVFLSDILMNKKVLMEKCGVEPVVYTYPFGFICEESLELVKGCGNLASLGVSEKPNYITSDKECLYCLNRYNRPASMSTEQFMEIALATE